MEIDVSAQNEGLRKIALGFDFDFNPICLLEDSFTHKHHLDTESENWHNWSSVLADGFKWDKIIEGSHVHRRKIDEGIWALKGHRLYGLVVLLSEHYTNNGWGVTLKRDQSRSPSIWEFHVDDLVGPSRERHPKILRCSFGSRRNFQKAYGLDDTDEGLEEGDDLLKSLYPFIGHDEPVWRPLHHSTSQENHSG